MPAAERYLFWKEEPKKRTWHKIADTLKARQSAIKNGAMFFTWTSFQDNGQPEPHRWGKFPLDFDSKENPQLALDDIRQLCLVHLPEFYDIDPYTIDFYASGEKGFHAEIPPKLFDAQDGDPHLPLIYKRIAAGWAEKFDLKTLDLSMYSMGQGKMFRIPNVKRPNNRYKVPLTLEEVRDLSIFDLLDLTKAPREIEPVEVDLVECEGLGRLYRNIKTTIYQELGERPEEKPLTDKARSKLAEKLPPCTAYIITALPKKTDRINFNKLTMQLVKYFQSVGWSRARVWQSVRHFVESYQDYDTEEKRISHWKQMWTYLEGNDKYAFDCSYIKGLGLPGSAFECSNCIGEKKPGRKRLLSLTTIQSAGGDKEVRWLWREHIPAGMPVIVNGREGIGKTTNCIAMGKEILEENPDNCIIWVASEGFVKDTINKMQELQVDPERFFLFQREENDFQFNFTQRSDLKALDEVLAECADAGYPCLAVFIDSIRGISPHGDEDSKIGKVLMAINNIVCDRHQASLIYLDHWGKGEKQNLLDKAVGTTAKTAAVRAVYSILQESAYMRKIQCAKINLLGQEPPELKSVQTGHGVIIYPGETRTDYSLVAKAEKFLIEIFSKQTSYLATDIYEEAEKRGIGEETLKKAKKKLDIQSRKPDGIGGSWSWVCETFYI